MDKFTEFFKLIFGGIVTAVSAFLGGMDGIMYHHTLQVRQTEQTVQLCCIMTLGNGFSIPGAEGQ